MIILASLVYFPVLLIVYLSSTCESFCEAGDLYWRSSPFFDLCHPYLQKTYKRLSCGIVVSHPSFRSTTTNHTCKTTTHTLLQVIRHALCLCSINVLGLIAAVAAMPGCTRYVPSFYPRIPLLISHQR